MALRPAELRPSPQGVPGSAPARNRDVYLLSREWPGGLVRASSEDPCETCSEKCRPTAFHWRFHPQRHPGRNVSSRGDNQMYKQEWVNQHAAKTRGEAGAPPPPREIHAPGPPGPGAPPHPPPPETTDGFSGA